MLDGNTEEEYAAENNAIEQYREKYFAAVVSIEEIQQCVTSVHPPGSVTSFGSCGGRNCSERSCGDNKKKTFKLPKIELRKFSGDVTEWLSWWSQFAKIHEDEDLHASDKFHYLVQSMEPGSRARDVVESYPQTSENYPKAIKALKTRFGRDEMLVEVYVRELQKLVISNVKSRERQKLSKMFDKLESHLRALESIGVTSDNYAAMLYPMVESSLPEEVLRAWKRSPLSNGSTKEEQNRKSKLTLLMDFLRNEVESEESIALARAGFGNTESKEKKKDKIPKEDDEDDEYLPTAAGLFSGQVSKCIFCEKSHASIECHSAQRMSLEERKEILKAKRCCLNCLRKGHFARDCKTGIHCILCQKRHFIFLCPELPEKKSDMLRKSDHRSESTTTTTCTAYSTNVVEVPLQTFLVRLFGKRQSRLVRIVLDSGSHRSYIRKDLVSALQLKSHGQELIRKSLFGGGVTKMEQHAKFEIKIEDLSCKIQKHFEVLDQEVICGRVQNIRKGKWMKELEMKNIRLNDLQDDKTDIDILIGNDYYGQLLTGEVEQLECGLTAINTIFGWTLSGHVPISESIGMMVTSLMVNELTIGDLWDLETIGIRDPVESLNMKEKEEATKKHFVENVKRENDGRYCVALPWIDGMQKIPDNKSVAEGRLISTTNKLKSVGEYQAYDDIFTSWLSEGIIEEVPESEFEIPSYYLPHRAVFKPQSLTTPIRPVFDAACKSKRSPSLNECLDKGPNLLELIPSIMMRFREKRIGISSDIRKAFLMISLREDDRNFLRFLWWQNSVTRELKIYRHKRVVFGVNSSPFLLAAVIEHHLKQVNNEDSVVAQKLLKSLYVDNCLTSVDSMENASLFRETTTRIMAEAKFELRQWEFTVQCSVDDLIGLRTENDSTKIHLTSVLGMKWDKQADTLGLEMPTDIVPEKITKRNVMSCFHKIYDPMGFFCPVLITPKLLIQQSFVKKSNWNSEFDEGDKVKFFKWANELISLGSIWIPRNISGGCNDRRNWQFHVFCDASKFAYAAVIFLRTENNGNVSVQLVQAKSRVTPLKKMTINRLELLSCNIGSRLVHSVKEAMELKISIYCWTDSTTALAWIRRNDDWGTFVGNRVKEICGLTEVTSWRHIPGEFNPADLPSRGCNASELLASQWWEGPSWLKEPENNWPKSNEQTDEELVQQEKRKGTVKCMFTAETEDPWYCKQSSYLENVRTVAFMMRFFENTKSKKYGIGNLKPLSVAELKLAEERIWKMVQKETLPAENVIEGLRVTRCENGFVRVKTKLTYRRDSKAFRWPILLPESHPIVDQLIKETHRMYCHAGIQFLMGKLRENVWIIRSRKTIHRVLSNCTNCLRFTSKRIEVVPAPLPYDRINDSEVFQVTGVDLAGPLYLKDQSKTWVVLFTCAVYRCIHLELVTSLGTDTFLMALERFVKRRRRPDTVYSDNGTNFTGAVNGFKLIDWTEVENDATEKKIVWKFNPPSVPWWGGWWERLIRMIKDLLKRTLGKSKLNYEELLTMIIKVEAIINGRPLTYVTEDSEDLIPLTPSMFLQENTDVELPEVDNLGDKLRMRFKYQNKLKKDLKGRFRKEYLALLVEKGNEPKSKPVRVGDIVLVGEDNKKRLYWSIGRIIKILPGKDGHSRVVELKTKSGKLIRPFQRLYSLEISSSEELPNPCKFVEPDGNVTQERKKLAKKETPVKNSIPKKPTTPEITTRYGRQIKIPNRFEQL